MDHNEIELYVKTGSEAIEAAVNTPPGRETLELIADKVRRRRLMGQIELLAEANTRLEELGLEGWRVADKIVVPLLEFAGLEDDEDMLARWTNLLVSAAEDEATVLPSFPHILRDLSPREAKALDRLVRGDGTRETATVTVSDLASEFGLSAAEADDLERLGLIRFESGLTFGSIPANTSMDERGEAVAATNLGVALVSACRRRS